MIRQLVHALLTLLAAAGMAAAYRWSSRPVPEYPDATDVRVFRCALNPLGDPWLVTHRHWHELTPGGFDCCRREQDGRVRSRRYMLGVATDPHQGNSLPPGTKHPPATGVFGLPTPGPG
jgi:hypothetical protein